MTTTGEHLGAELHEHRPGWQARAACRGVGPDVFYPADMAVRHGVDPYAMARRLCAGCPVREPCREAGMSEAYGMWGGLTEADCKGAAKGVRSA